MTSPTILSPTDYGILSRQDFVDEFAYRYEPGQHVIGIGPTGRGKTTLFGQILPHCKTSGTLISCLGRDDALSHLGKACKTWPPKIPLKLAMYDEIPFVRRYEGLPRSREDFPRIRKQNEDMLLWMFGREDWTIFFPDLQIITDPRMMNLGKQVEELLLTLRKAKSAVWMDAQAPRWIPGAAKDQVQHLIIFRNRSRVIMKDLADIAGLDVQLVYEMFDGGQFHDAVWVDVRRDEYYIVESS